MRLSRLRALLRDANLIAYIFLTLLAMLAVVNWADPPIPAGAGCRIGYVYDGDSVELICGETRETARLLGLDSAELKGSCTAEIAQAKAAKQALTDLVRGAKSVRIDIHGRDKYRRPLIRLWLDGKDAAGLMIKAGQARAYDGGQRLSWCN